VAASSSRHAPLARAVQLDWTRVTLALLLALGVACATAGAPGGADSGGDDDILDGGGGGLADAPPGTADAPPGTPDASMAGAPDAGPSCAPCQLVAQCGCENNASNPACDIADVMGGTTCRAVTAPGMATSTCNGVTGCAPGYICLGAAGQSTCSRFCGSDAQCAGGGGLGAIGVVSGTTPIPSAEHPSGNLHVCSPACNPFDGSGCATGYGCSAYFSTEQARNFTACFFAGTGVDNATCTGDESCASGFTCVNVGGVNRCKKYCSVGGTPGCTSGTCINLVDGNSNNIVIGGVTYGVCN
jgi:hypothetical protein